MQNLYSKQCLYTKPQCFQCYLLGNFLMQILKTHLFRDLVTRLISINTQLSTGVNVYHHFCAPQKWNPHNNQQRKIATVVMLDCYWFGSVVCTLMSQIKYKIQCWFYRYYLSNSTSLFNWSNILVVFLSGMTDHLECQLWNLATSFQEQRKERTPWLIYFVCHSYCTLLRSMNGMGFTPLVFGRVKGCSCTI